MPAQSAPSSSTPFFLQKNTFFRWGIRFGTGRQRCRKTTEPGHEAILKLFSFTLLFPSLLRQAPPRLLRRCGSEALRTLYIPSLLLQLLLQSLLRRRSLLLKTVLEQLLLLQRLLLHLPLLIHERLEHPFLALLHIRRCCSGSTTILYLLLHELCLLLHQLRLLLLLLLQKVKDNAKIGDIVAVVCTAPARPV